ncbi:hypothetical protein SXIM_42690 [Streptomyces xiamenensis]|uniref:Uncharacterized protein n=1 Tax=Streptomyces xiamenensis TaxID=408015 RepID=A0A0F7FZH7_9ACTN|nr:hypothetical protein SXIM_42690 [Streptomyces xiamenensis]
MLTVFRCRGRPFAHRPPFARIRAFCHGRSAGLLTSGRRTATER